MAKHLRFVPIPDLHLGKKRLLDLFGEDATRMILAGVRRVLDEAIGMGIPHAFFLGDISDTPTLRDVDELAFIRLLHEYDGRINISIIPGNHDIEQRTVHALCKVEEMCGWAFQTVQFYREHTVRRIDGVRVEFMPYPVHTPRHTNSVCVAHIERAGSVRDNGSRGDGGVELPAGHRLWVIGHLHTPQEHYPGTLDQKSYGEAPAKRWVDIEAWMESGTLHWRWNDHPWEPEFRLETVDYSALPELDTGGRVRYRVTNLERAAIPDGWLLEHPMVSDLVAPGRAAAEADAPDLSELDAVAPEQAESGTRRLRRYLRARGHRGADLRRARDLVQSAHEGHLLQRLNITG